MLVYVHDAEKENLSPKGVIMERKELRELIKDSELYKDYDNILYGEFSKEMNPKYLDDLITAILSAGYIKKSEIEIDEEKIKKVVADYFCFKDLELVIVCDLAHAIAIHLKDIIK